LQYSPLLDFFDNLSGILDEIVYCKPYDNDKKQNFEMSISYTADPATLEGTGGFRFEKNSRNPVFSIR
jgi:hypothetical protein